MPHAEVRAPTLRVADAVRVVALPTLGGVTSQEASSQVRSRRSPGVIWVAGAVLATLALSAVLVASYVRDQGPLSPFDEWVYVDYLDKVSRGELPEQGETIDEYALELSSCRGVFVWGPQGTACGQEPQLSDYPQAGVTSADIHPPTYFVVTNAAATVLLRLGVTDDLLTAGRLVGAGWLFLGLALMYVLGRDWGASRAASAALVLAVAVAPLTRYTNSYITPDAANLAVGAGVLLVASRWLAGRWPTWTLLAVGLVAGALKAQNLLAVGVAAVLVVGVPVLRVVPRRPDLTLKSSLIAAAVMMGGGLLAQVAWLAYRSAAAVGPSPAQGLPEGRPTLDQLVSETTSFVAKLGLGATEDALPVPVYGHWLSWLIIAGTLGAALVLGLRDMRGLVGGSLVLGLVLGGPALMIMISLISGIIVPSPARYGMVLLAGAGAVTAASLKDRWMGVALLALWGSVVGWVVLSRLLNVDVGG
jgi:hypothetical protein